MTNALSPDLSPLVPPGFEDLRLERDQTFELEFADAAAEVVQEDGLRRVELRPVSGLGKGVAVHMVGDVDPASRVGILQPGTTHVGVLFEDADLCPSLLKAMRRSDS